MDQEPDTIQVAPQSARSMSARAISWISEHKLSLFAFGTFFLGVSAFFANISTISSNLTKKPEPQALASPESSAPTPAVVGAPRRIPDRPGGEESTEPRQRTISRRKSTGPAERSEVKVVPAPEQVSGVRAGDYSVVVSNSANANTNTTFNFNSTIAVSEQ